MIVGRGFRPHLLDLMLRKEAAGELRRPGHRTGERRQPAGEQAGEGGLAVAVGAEEGDAVVRVEPQIEPRQHRLSGRVPGADPLERDQRRAPPPPPRPGPSYLSGAPPPPP